MSQTLKIELDRTGFPMIWIEEIQAHIHYLPLTKVQLEDFICSVPDVDFNHDWYKEQLDQNPRVSACQIKKNNYWGAFATGLLPSETERLAHWYGDDFDIPSDREWQSAYQSLKNFPASKLDYPNLRERPAALIDGLDRVITGLTHNIEKRQTLADRMFLRWGVFEWVVYQVGRHSWGAYGETHDNFHSQFSRPEQGFPLTLTRPEVDRFRYIGCRLIRRSR